MCFSATASFSAAALTGAIGVACLRRTRRPRDIPLACIPLLFGAQQAIEGLLWVGLRSNENDHINLLLAAVFTGIALVLWPVLAPIAVALREPKAVTRRLIYLLCPLGVIVAAYSVLLLTKHPYAPTIEHASICYISGTPYPMGGVLAYVLCTCMPPLLSSDKFLRITGIIFIVGLAVSALFFYDLFFSVWCFFAALASAAIFGSFQCRSLPASARA